VLGGFARRFVAGREDSRELLRLFQSYVTELENTVRWRWAPGDVAFWTTASTSTTQWPTTANLPRRVQRITLAGDVPCR